MPYKDKAARLAYQRDYHHRHAEFKNSRRIRHHLIDRLGFIVLAGKEMRCERCGFEGHPAALQFHHRDRSKKLFEIDRAIRRVRGQYRETDIIAEIKKCDLICANCHAIEHATYTQEDVISVQDEIRDILVGVADTALRSRWQNLHMLATNGVINGG